MKCFYHNASDAVGICKSCNKGICLECATEIGVGLACQNRCEAEVIAINQLIERNKRTHQTTGRAYAQYSIWLALAGVVFVGYGLYQTRKEGLIVFGLLGLIFLLGAIFSYSTSKKYKGIDESEAA
jgi:hypothetical protein